MRRACEVCLICTQSGITDTVVGLLLQLSQRQAVEWDTTGHINSLSMGQVRSRLT